MPIAKLSEGDDSPMLSLARRSTKKARSSTAEGNVIGKVELLPKAIGEGDRRGEGEGEGC